MLHRIVEAGLTFRVALENDLLWTEEHANELRGAADLLGSSTDFVDGVLNRLRSEGPFPVVDEVNRERMENYTIRVNGEMAGVVTAAKQVQRWELHVLVYTRFRGASRAKRSLAQVIRDNPARQWDALVELKNPDLGRMERMLIELGFRKDERQITPRGFIRESFEETPLNG